MLEHKKKEQIDIESEIYFLLSHQKELENFLISLEQELQPIEVSSCLNNKGEKMYVIKNIFFYYVK